MHSLRVISLGILLLVVGVGQPHAQKIVCWKDKSGKVIGCGDKVPPEYQDSAVKELNQRGVTIKQTAPALTAEQKRALQAEAERKKENEKLAAVQRRKDRALLDTFASEKEIDLKRNRDIQLLESNIEAQQTNLKNARDRQADASVRIEQWKKENKPVPAGVQQEYDRAVANQTKIQEQITQKRKEIVELNAQYDEMKKRYAELKDGAPDAKPATASGSK